jgi:hypothetical protein
MQSTKIQATWEVVHIQAQRDTYPAVMITESDRSIQVKASAYT